MSTALESAARTVLPPVFSCVPRMSENRPKTVAARLSLGIRPFTLRDYIWIQFCVKPTPVLGALTCVASGAAGHDPDGHGAERKDDHDHGERMDTGAEENHCRD